MAVVDEEQCDVVIDGSVEYGGWEGMMEESSDGSMARM